jgi:hypothetical protein
MIFYLKDGVDVDLIPDQPQFHSPQVHFNEIQVHIRLTFYDCLLYK